MLFLCRMNPKNAHQCPSVVVLCGPHLQGAQGVNCARHLAMHDVQVTLFLPNFIKMLPELEKELRLYELTGGQRCCNIKGWLQCAYFCLMQNNFCVERSLIWNLVMFWGFLIFLGAQNIAGCDWLKLTWVVTSPKPSTLGCLLSLLKTGLPFRYITYVYRLSAVVLVCAGPLGIIRKEHANFSSLDFLPVDTTIKANYTCVACGVLKTNKTLTIIQEYFWWGSLWRVSGTINSSAAYHSVVHWYHCRSSITGCTVANGCDFSQTCPPFLWTW